MKGLGSSRNPISLVGMSEKSRTHNSLKEIIQHESRAHNKTRSSGTDKSSIARVERGVRKNPPLLGLLNNELSKFCSFFDLGVGSDKLVKSESIS